MRAGDGPRSSDTVGRARAGCTSESPARSRARVATSACRPLSARAEANKSLDDPTLRMALPNSAGVAARWTPGSLPIIRPSDSALEKCGTARGRLRDLARQSVGPSGPEWRMDHPHIAATVGCSRDLEVLQNTEPSDPSFFAWQSALTGWGGAVRLPALVDVGGGHDEPRAIIEELMAQQRAAQHGDQREHRGATRHGHRLTWLELRKARCTVH